MHKYIAQALEAKRSLLEPEALQLFFEYGLPVPKFMLAKNPEQAVNAARQLGYPVVLKIVSPDILHKSDVGGVKVSICSDEEVIAAFEEIMENAQVKAQGAAVEGVLVVPNAPKGVECIVGVVKDPQFGPAIMFGLGGIFVEILQDVSFALLPLSRHEAEAMIKETRGYQLLKGQRGEGPKDIDALIDLLLRVAVLVEENPEIKEIDINPLFVYEKGLQIVDARVIV